MEPPGVGQFVSRWHTDTLTATHVYNWFDAFGRDPFLDPACPADAQIPCDEGPWHAYGGHDDR